MNLHSPVVALLWENWRLSRSEALQRVSLGMVGAAAAMTFGKDTGPYIAFVILVTLFAMIWFSISKLNGGQLMDGYKPGFPLYLLYTRPVSTFKFVSITVAYDAISCLVLYLVCAAIIGLVFARPLPLFSVAIWLVTFHLLYLAFQWATRSRVIQWIGAIAFSWLYFFLIKDAFEAPMQIEFSLAANALMVLLGIAAFAATVVGVSRQRSGNAVSTVPRSARVNGYPDWLISPFRISCPTSSATKAQIWYELRSSGLPILVIGVMIALAMALVFALGIPFPPAREAAIGIPLMLGVPTLLLLGSNAFGIRKKQGRTYLSPFEATQPYATSHMTALKILVRSGCMLVALLTVIAGLWMSSALIGSWDDYTTIDGKEVLPKLLQARGKILNSFVGWTTVAYVQFAVITAISVAAIVALFATYASLRVRYGTRPLFVLAALPSWFLTLVVLGFGERTGAIPKSVIVTYLAASGIAALAILTVATVYLFWSGFKDKSLTIAYLLGAVLVSAVFVAACLPSDNLFTMGLPALIPLIPLIAAPWSLGRIRHT